MFYEEIGEGNPLLLLLHGNTASSKLFSGIVSRYTDLYKVILVDFIGYGQSERVEKLEEDLWYDQAMQVCAFLGERNYGPVNLIGTSGGALTAINVALEHPELVRRSIADSFAGEHADSSITEILIKGREASKQNPGARMFYEMMNGYGWEKVVDVDTEAVISHAKNVVEFFHKSISELKIEILFTGSQKDDMFPSGHYERLFGDILAKTNNAHQFIFDEGSHPAMISNSSEFVCLSKELFKN